MEKFYRINQEHKIYELYREYKDMSHRVNEAFKEFSKEIGLEAPSYYQFTTSLSVVDLTQADREKFKEHFKAHAPGDFKKTSVYSKMWVKKCADLGLESPDRPRLWWYFNPNGKSRNRLVEVDGLLYASFESDASFTAPKDFVEIPGSEFYRVIEEYNERVKDGQ